MARKMISLDGVTALLTHWLTEIADSDGLQHGSDDDVLDSLAALVGDAVDSITIEDGEAPAYAVRTAMQWGYLLGVGLTVAVLEDPVGDPTTAMRDEIEYVKDGMRDYSRV